MIQYPARQSTPLGQYAAAQADVPWLLAEVARLDAVVTAVRDALYSHHPSTAEAVLAARRALDGVDRQS